MASAPREGHPRRPPLWLEEPEERFILARCEERSVCVASRCFADSLRPFCRCLPQNLGERATGWVTGGLRIWRNRVLIACAVEIFFSVASLPLGARRGGKPPWCNAAPPSDSCFRLPLPLYRRLYPGAHCSMPQHIFSHYTQTLTPVPPPPLPCTSFLRPCTHQCWSECGLRSHWRCRTIGLCEVERAVPVGTRYIDRHSSLNL
jgi:hypothetical protein